MYHIAVKCADAAMAKEALATWKRHDAYFREASSPCDEPQPFLSF
ncbi:MAG: hypothetical protein PUI81_05225 [Veillonellaceae bacterium]|nr:hypothetical protein [Veillonellaceae bacterium]